MVNKAIVAGIGEDWIDCLSLDETERKHDETCGTGGSCGSTGCGCRVTGHPFKAARPRNLNLKVGDTVEISTTASGILLGSLAVLGLPIAAAVAAWFGINAARPELAEGLKAAVAAAALILTAMATAFIGGRRKNRGLPEISAVRR